MPDNDPDNIAYVPTPKAGIPYRKVAPDGSVIPFTQGSGTYAVSASLSTAFNFQIVNAVWLRSFSIVPLSSTIGVAFFFRYGSWTIGTNPPVVNGSFTISGVAFSRDFKDGTGRYPQLNSGDTLQLILIASGSGYVTIDIDGEYA